jgi:hypothetical protein
MRALLDPFSFVVIAIAGWMNQHQQQVIEYLMEEADSRNKRGGVAAGAAALVSRTPFVVTAGSG